MKRFLSHLFAVRDGVPLPALVFFVFALVGSAQAFGAILSGRGYLAAGILLNEFLFVAAVPVLLARLFRADLHRIFPFPKPPLATLFLVATATIGALVVLDYMTSASERFIPVPASVRAMLERMLAVEGEWDLFYKVFLLALVPGVCEELFFRGFCQTSLVARWGTRFGLLTAALLFMSLHPVCYWHLYLLLGALIGTFYALTGSLWVPMFVHVMNNAWTVLGHAAGATFPVGPEMQGRDGVLIVSGTALLVVSLWLLVKRSRTRSIAADARLTKR